MLQFNPILATDSYKFSHSQVYPANMRGMAAWITARTKGKDTIVPFGLQMVLKKYLSTPFHVGHIDEAEAFCKLHGEPFNRGAFESILYRSKGYWPVQILAVPEGTPVPSGHALVTIISTDPTNSWVVSFIEDVLQRAVWYPTTIASGDYAFKRKLRELYIRTGADLAGLDFALHDFGARGVTCHEQAEIGGAAHLVNFKGSDTIEGIRAMNYYYGSEMAGFSVPASEHSIQCSYGSSQAGQLEYLKKMLDTYAKPGAIVSIVIDGYDTIREAQALAFGFREQIIKSGAKVVFRPDSGDMFDVVPKLLAIQELAFGSTSTREGYKKINYVAVLQGDGIDYESGIKLLEHVVSLGYSPDNVVLGSGGGLLQKVNRDTFKFAQKTTAVLLGDKWVETPKSPITDPGKNSPGGILQTYRSRLTGEYYTFNTLEGRIDSEWENIMKPVYLLGDLYNETTTDEIRGRCKI